MQWYLALFHKLCSDQDKQEKWYLQFQKYQSEEVFAGLLSALTFIRNIAEGRHGIGPEQGYDNSEQLN